MQQSSFVESDEDCIDDESQLKTAMQQSSFVESDEDCIDVESQLKTAMQQISFVESDVTKNEVMFVWSGDAHAPSFLAISPSFWSDLKNSFRVEFS